MKDPQLELTDAPANEDGSYPTVSMKDLQHVVRDKAFKPNRKQRRRLKKQLGEAGAQAYADYFELESLKQQYDNLDENSKKNMMAQILEGVRALKQEEQNHDED